MPKLQLLERTTIPDTVRLKSDSTKKITSDSARIISPAIRSIITSDSIEVEVAPLCAVDSIMIFVHHSENTTDTLGTFTPPLFKSVWHCKNIPDQDQLHLQCGYTLFLTSNLTITSPPQTHRWVLDRKKEYSQKKCTISQPAGPDVPQIDGHDSEWKRVKAISLGDAGKFRMLWSDSHLFFCVEIFDTSVTWNDFVELHFDIHNDKASFADSHHRSIRFGPKTRSNCFTVSLNDSGFKILDSINVLISREMKWSKSFVPNGYILEISIPFFVLSDIHYPQKQIGFDISSTNVDSGVSGHTFTSWAGSSNSEHYNPSQWGTAVLSQAMFPLRFVILAGLIFFSLCIALLIFLLIKQHYKERKYEHAEESGYSDFMKSIIDLIDKTISEINISDNAIAKQLNTTIEKITTTIHAESGTDFSVLLQFRRILMAKRLLRETDLTLNDISLQTGFKSTEIFSKKFLSLTGVEPTKYRQRAREELQDEED